MKRQAIAYIKSLPTPQPRRGTITEADIADFPPIVQRYFRFSQVVGKPRIDSFGVVTEGRIRRSRDAKWMTLESQQHNLLSHPARIYYVRATGTPMSGVDSYVDGVGRMRIKLFNLIPLADVGGSEMSRSGLVSFLNDLIFCPLAYFSVPMEWRRVDEQQAELSFTDHGMTVRAVLSFDKDGRLLNWESDDRYAEVKGTQLPDRWSTPMTQYAELHGLRIPVSGRGIHNYDGEPFSYVELSRVTRLVPGSTALPEPA